MCRWYTKRATQFAPGFPHPGGLEDAPPIPPADPLASSAAKAATAAAAAVLGPSRTVGSTTGGGTSAGVGIPPRPPAAGRSSVTSILVQHSGSSSSGGGVGARLGPSGTGVRTSSSGGGGGGGGGGGSDMPPNRTPRGSHSGTCSGDSHSSPPPPPPTLEAEPNRGGRSLCRLADPVMSLIELSEMLEEIDVVPHLVTRQDVVEIFRAVMQVWASVDECGGGIEGCNIQACRVMMRNMGQPSSERVCGR